VPNVRIKGWVRVFMQTFDRVGVWGPTFAIGCLTGTASLQIEENSELNQIRLKDLCEGLIDGHFTHPVPRSSEGVVRFS
jgi:hypothetical protein